MIKIFRTENIKQFISYFFVGGIAAVVEWVMFFVFDGLLHVEYLLATVLAFIFSTTVNMILGRLTAFKNSRQYKGKEVIETILVFAVSGIGLVFNLILMYIFVSVIGMDTSLLKVIAKIAATGIVFIWNFLIRKLVIYKA